MAITQNKVVSMFYELKDTENNLLDTNINGSPLSFIMGRNQIIPGLENEIAKKNQGDSFNVMVKAADAYGEYNKDAVQSLPAEQFAGIQLEQGMTLYGQGEDGQTVQVTVKEFDEQSVLIDYNNPLAGKDLYFKVDIAEVRDATEDELESGYVAGSQSCACDHGDECCGGHHHEDGDCCGRH